ncbi:uncharacterized protein LOC106948334 [Poecilia latipinna]|uniref:Uncharacterized LOC106948334 n=1 Tax=Poecilia latipinna TaxID=48699 RepID=A0A3B3VI09_9TELE|nr:PREDICTED: uncharacterized protein LOC106948334 [Poecilia latipinna]XP_014889428.1 PREDICTED: uncharacterized protein LOC106948334 [Poecilia latipinna]
MQLHVCLLLFFFTTDKAVMLHQHCGGNVTLDQEPEGHITLLLPEFFNHTGSLSPISQQSDERLPLSNCTWLLGIPLRKKLLLQLKWTESNWRISLRCVEEDQILQSRGETVLLSDCDENRAVLSWTGPRISSNSIHLTYCVQEAERNSSEGESIHQQQQDHTGWLVTEASNKSIATYAQRVVKGTAEGRGRVHEGQICSFGTRSASSTFSQDKELLQPTSSQWGLPVAGRTDRETLPLPEEKWNNEADTSGATHLADTPTTAITRPYFQPAVSTDTKTENPTGLTRVQTETSWTDTKVTLSITTDLQRSTSGEMMKMEKFVTQMDGHTDMQTNQSISSFSVFNSSLPGILTSDSSTSINPHGGAVDQTPENKQAQSDGFYAAFTSITSSKTVKSSIKQHDSTSTEPSLSSPSSSQGSSWAPSPTTRMVEIPTGVEAALPHPHTAQSDSSESDISSQRAAVKSTDGLDNTDGFHTVIPSTQSQTKSPENMERLSHSLHSSPIQTQTPGIDTQTSTEGMQRSGTNLYITTNMMQTLFNEDGSFSTSRPAQIIKFQTSAGTTTIRQMHTPSFSETLNSPMDSSTPSYGFQKQTGLPDGTQVTFPSSMAESSMDTSSMNPKTTSESSETFRLFPLSSATVSPNKHVTTENTPSHPVKSDSGDMKGTTSWQWSPSGTMKHNRQGGPTQAFHPSQQNHFGVTSSVLTPSFKGSSTKSPIYYIIPNQPATVRVESVELLLQIVVEEPCSTLTAGLEEDMMPWLESYLQRAPGFRKLLGVWSSGQAVQSLVVFQTSEALQWLSVSGAMSLLEQTGLAQAVHQGKMFRSCRITNITVGGLQGDVCNWLLQCPSGYKCVVQPGTTNYSCSSACRYDYCHNHGICTHHSGQLPVCRCLVGDDFWYMGQRCDMRMTRARLIGACLTILLIIVMLIGILACLAVRRYRAILIQAKVDQTRSSYRRFNHFDELSGRFWLRSWAGSADSLDNPAFMRSDELLHLQALDRPCCYHDDTLSLPSTCPSHGMHINTIYPHSSQYGWRGSGLSMGDGVLDSGKASDLSVCSWPVEPIHWTPFPLLQQLASHRNPAVRMSRPRSYCEGMELVDMGKSWTA